MTLTTEQCIEIAEKLWGYEWLNNPNGIMGVWLDDNRRTLSIPFVCYKKEVIKKEVNSWQGFGRTVEAMSLPVYGVFRINATDMYADYLRGLHSKEILWKQTHLQALEALKND